MVKGIDQFQAHFRSYNLERMWGKGNSDACSLVAVCFGNDISKEHLVAKMNTIKVADSDTTILKRDFYIFYSFIDLH